MAAVRCLPRGVGACFCHHNAVSCCSCARFPLISRGVVASTRKPQLHMRPLPKSTPTIVLCVHFAVSIVSFVFRGLCWLRCACACGVPKKCRSKSSLVIVASTDVSLSLMLVLCCRCRSLCCCLRSRCGAPRGVLPSSSGSQFRCPTSNTRCVLVPEVPSPLRVH